MRFPLFFFVDHKFSNKSFAAFESSLFHVFYVGVFSNLLSKWEKNCLFFLVYAKRKPSFLQIRHYFIDLLYQKRGKIIILKNIFK